jgi:DNA-binding MarR family transcriptional regulator
MQEAGSERVETALAIVRQAIARITALSDAIGPALTGVSLRAVAERLYSERRRRDEHFPPGLFGEPAWDLLLALFIAREEGRELTLREAYAAAKVEPRDGPALIERLAEAGMVVRSRTPRDRRRPSVVLTGRAVERLSDYLADLV